MSGAEARVRASEVKLEELPVSRTFPAPPGFFPFPGCLQVTAEGTQTPEVESSAPQCRPLCRLEPQIQVSPSSPLLPSRGQRSGPLSQPGSAGCRAAPPTLAPAQATLWVALGHIPATGTVTSLPALSHKVPLSSAPVVLQVTVGLVCAADGW